MKDIIDMAREAGFDRVYLAEETALSLLVPLKRFEALVRADEREACAQMVEELNEIGHSYGLENRIRARGQA